MKVLILAAGYGTRLYALGEKTPKSLLDIGGKPLLNHILQRVEQLKDLNEVIVVTNNKFFDTFQTWADGLKDFKYSIKIVNDGTNTPEERLGSIGDIEFSIQKENIQDDLLIVGGDNLFDFNLNEYLDFASPKTGEVTIGVYDIENLVEARLFGVVATDEHSKITSFEEKPEQPKSTLVAMCFYYLPKATIGLIGDYLNATKVSDTAGDYIRWLCEKTVVYGFKFIGKWYDIGSVEAYQDAKENFK